MVLIRAIVRAASLAALLLMPCRETRAQTQLDLETGIIFASYNDAEIPRGTGTRFSLTDDLGSDHEPFFRGRISYRLAGRHTVSLLIAQLSLPASGQLGKPLMFAGASFPAGKPLKAEYRFDSYRLTYRYALRRNERFEAGIGVTAKIRDAEITIESADEVASKKNTGFVPLLNFMVRWRFEPRFWCIVEGDALGAPQGRAEDVLLAVQYWASEDLGFKLGYRVLEGGVNVEETYNFAWLNYVVLGLYANF